MGKGIEPPAVLRGSLPQWSETTGDGSGGYGYGSGDGDGSGGSGYGSGGSGGSGYGHGSGGYGYGHGDGDGSGGSGYGHGSGGSGGSGYGHGSGGYGYGDGDGYGYGHGDGYGSGSGYGYWPLVANSAVLNWPKAQRDRYAHLSANDAFFAFWKSDKAGKPSNGGYCEDPARPGLVQSIEGPLKVCTPRALHGTLNPDKWKGDRLWIVALFGELQFDSDKVGALKREILGEVPLS